LSVNDNSLPSNSTTLERDLESGRALLEAGRHLEALQHFGGALQRHRDQAAVYEGASQALVAALGEETVLDRWDGAERDLFYSTLILQEHCHTNPPILHHRIASQHSSGAAGFIGHISRKLGAVVRRLLESRAINKNLVLLILLLRESLGDGFSQEEISRLHIAWVEKFTCGDLTIPYNCMFDSVTFRRNRLDIVSHLPDFRRKADSGGGLSLFHIVFFEWLSGQTLVSNSGAGLMRLLDAHLRPSPAAPEELAAAKSLVIRHWHPDEPREEPVFSAPGFESGFAELALDTNRIRSELRHQSSPGPTGLGVRLFDKRAWQGLRAAANLSRSRLPFLRRRGRKIKVAVCISGQLRGYANAFATWKRTLLQNVDYELFVDSWLRIGRSGAEHFRYVLPFEGPRFTEKYREVCRQAGMEEFKESHPALFTALTDTGLTTKDELCEFYGTPHVRLDDDSQPPFAALSNPEKMHRKIQSCFDMAMGLGREYDLIIRLRPDKPIRYLGYDWADLRELCHANPTLFADHATGVHYANLMIGDQFAVGAQPPMQTYSETWTHYPRFAAHGLFKCPGSFQGHASLAQVCWLHGIIVRKAPIGFGALQEPARLPAKTILRCLEEDAAGRMNRTDRLLLEAISSDLKQ
jgi:hypothetical protein